MILKA